MRSGATPGLEGLPPHDLDAEAGVLGAVLVDPVRSMPEVESIVEPADFYSEAHRRVFEAMTEVASATGPATVDVISVGSWLRSHGRLDQVGGMAYVTELLNGASSGLNAWTHARTVRDRSVARRLIVLCQRTAARAQLEPGELESVLAEHEKSVSELASSRANAGTLEPVGGITARMFREMHARFSAGERSLGRPTGFSRLDRMMGGLHPGDVTIVAARPGMGKTSLALNVAANVANIDGKSDVVAFSLEMPKEQFAMRMLCSAARVDLSCARAGNFSSQQWSSFTTAVADTQQLGVHIDDTSRSMSQIRASIRQKQTELGRQGRSVRLAVIDYLGLMKFPRAERHDIAIGEVTKAMKAMAKELKIPVWILCQLNRGVEQRQSKRPGLADLRDSGDIEQDADNVVFIYRDDYYDSESEERNIAELIIAKQRNGPTGVAKVRFDKEWTRFDNLADGEFEEEPA